MNKIFYLFLSFFSMFSANAQIHEIGVFLGGSNYIGDIGSTSYISPNEVALGVLYKWNKSPRHAYRFSYTQSKMTANDLDSKESSRKQRGYDIESNIKEAYLGLEFNFLDFDLHRLERKTTPYVSSGLGYFLLQYNLNKSLSPVPSSIPAKGRTERRKSIAIPIILGIKTTISPRLIAALEVGARYTLTDNIDGSFYKKIGNINNNDWYVFSGATLTYTFGEKPCYCPQ